MMLVERREASSGTTWERMSWALETRFGRSRNGRSPYQIMQGDVVKGLPVNPSVSVKFPLICSNNSASFSFWTATACSGR